MNQNRTDCDYFRTLIYCLDEPVEDCGIEAHERQQLLQHLVICDSCLDHQIQEQRLTNHLASSGNHFELPGKQGRWVPANFVWNNLKLLACVIAIGLTMGFGLWIAMNLNQPKQIVAGADSTFGSMVSRPIVGGSTHFEPRNLDSNNHIDLPSGSTALIELSETGRVDVMGPAVLEIDRMRAGWKITLLNGRIKTTLNGKQPVVMVCNQGMMRLDQGTYFVSTESGIQQEDSKQDKSSNQEKDFDIKKTLEEGLKVFQADSNAKKEDFQKASVLLAKVFEHPDSSKGQKLSAGFYGVAAMMNSGQPKAALKLGTKWQMSFKNSMGETMSVMMSQAHAVLGNKKEAKAIAKEILKKYPKTPYRTSLVAIAEDSSAGSVQSGSRRRLMPAAQPPYTSREASREFVAQQKDGYLVVNVALKDSTAMNQQFQAVSKKVVNFHQADSIAFDGKDFSKLRQQIVKRHPKYVLFVIPPKKLDVNFHREVFKIAPTLDNDLFVDFSWGYLTAEDGKELAKFWERIEKLHRAKKLSNNNWLSTSVIGGKAKSSNIKGDIPPAAKAAGFEGSQVYFGLRENDPQVFKFIDQQKSAFENASIITMTGNGDPQGIWLFDDSRNANPKMHWKFEKEKVGQDPKNEMARLKSGWFSKLKLSSPVVWSGTCHSGACHRVYVEGDIVSTFGTSEKTEVYDLPVNESLCLAMIRAGAGSLLVPIASNHGLAVSLETDFMIRYGATLGETIVSTYNDAILQSGGVPKLLVAKEGSPHNYWGEPIMQSGAINRILIGDPALRPIKKATQIAGEDQTIKYEPSNKKIEVQLAWKKGYHPSSWNLFADGRGYGYRMKTRVNCSDMKELLGKKDQDFKIETVIVDANGKKVACESIVAIESIAGKTFLHIQASADERNLPHSEHKATFQIKWK